jgi:hypothetical protein
MTNEKRDLDKELQEVLMLAQQHNAMANLATPNAEDPSHGTTPNFYWVSNNTSNKGGGNADS